MRRFHDDFRNNTLLGVTIHLNPWERHIKFRCFYFTLFFTYPFFVLALFLASLISVGHPIPSLSLCCVLLGHLPSLFWCFVTQHSDHDRHDLYAFSVSPPATGKQFLRDYRHLLKKVCYSFSTWFVSRLSSVVNPLAYLDLPWWLARTNG